MITQLYLFRLDSDNKSKTEKILKILNNYVIVECNKNKWYFQDKIKKHKAKDGDIIQILKTPSIEYVSIKIYKPWQLYLKHLKLLIEKKLGLGIG